MFQNLVSVRVSHMFPSCFSRMEKAKSRRSRVDESWSSSSEEYQARVAVWHTAYVAKLSAGYGLIIFNYVCMSYMPCIIEVV